MTKAEAKASKAEWKRALSEGRVVRLDGGLTFKSFPTAEATMAFLVEAAKAEVAAEIVKVP